MGPSRKPEPTHSKSEPSKENTEDGILQPQKKAKRLQAEVPLPMDKRSVAVREKTIERTKEAQKRFAEWEKRQIEKEQKKQDEPKADELDRVSQEEQMMEAAMTEQANIQSLMLLQQIELTLTLIHI
eukprot:TRINITY_DN16975_c0_g1_i2.p3 TRINITY_DN16975_c0_g1~~TRINITY_DN16975_c0_g1_i2.p3  ORF type:complete len:127 (+),score=38.07 TRINITY_DN16975_c0_g1_i2:3-383(+)